MIKRALLVISALVLMPLPALAENGCDGPCYSGRHWSRGYDRHYDRYHGARRADTFVSINLGTPYPRYYHRPYPYYYRPARVVYVREPVVYAQPEVIYINDQNSREVDNGDGRYCREYTTNARIGGRTQQTYGTACMQPDGSWEIIS